MRAVLVHGFTQSPSAWDAVRGRLAQGAGPRLDVLAPAVPDDLDFVATADHLARAHGPAVFCGYSMGGRLCLRAALEAPHLVRGLVVVSASPGIEDDDERAARARADDELANDVARAGVEAFLRRWLTQPLFATLPAGRWNEAAQRAGHTTVARLQHQLRVLGQGAQEPLWSRLSELDIPVSVVTGTGDERYGRIGDRMAAGIRGAVRVRAEGGHALPLEAPAAVADAVGETVTRAAGHDPPR
jgi:2-succinyl-6-hydroxy-2,4-cyclohexadiene-1-carboxylate synthase